jgi:hypothetical protein
MVRIFGVAEMLSPTWSGLGLGSCAFTLSIVTLSVDVVPCCVENRDLG